MRRHPDLRVLFATDFSAACARAARSLDQLASLLYLDVTIVHATRDAGRSEVRKALDATPPHASGTFRCRRVALEAADPARAIAHLCEAAVFDLAVVPGTGRLHWSHLAGQSFRRRFRARCRVPMWTLGRDASDDALDRPVRTVGALVDFDDRPALLLHRAARFAEAIGAGLIAFALVPPTDDALMGAVAGSEAPVTAHEAASRLATIAQAAGVPVDFPVQAGTRASLLRRIRDHRSADILFVGPAQASTALSLSGLPRDLERLPCPVVCVGDNDPGLEAVVATSISPASIVPGPVVPAAVAQAHLPATALG